jgi:type IV secretion system protein VirB10
MAETQSAGSAKISNTDPSLLLKAAPRINKKIIRLFLGAAAGVFLVAAVMAFSPRKPRPQGGAETDENGNIIIRRPWGLEITENDYLPPSPAQPETPPPLPEEITAGSYSEDYPSYDRRPRPEAVIRDSPAPAVLRGDNASQAAPREREKRSIFYNALPAGLTPLAAAPGSAAGQGADGTAAAALDRQSAALENAYASDYQKQNMNTIKQSFIENARQTGNFSTYLPSMYLPPIDPYHEIKSGTFIPVTLVSSIHSDIPGPVEAQVLENVYDTYSGNNILIPGGTRVHGEYSSSVAFGQNRVLAVWQSMTLPDGVTVNLQGMQGTDLRGVSGLADKVDYHIDSIIYAVGLSTVWDIAKAAVISSLSTTQFLSDINQALNAEGSASAATGAATQSIVTSYANKLLNQQPTITIREGTRGHVFVSKDIILPSYGVF